jgi:hypothetical protein
LIRNLVIALVCTLIILVLIPPSVLAEGTRPSTGTFLKDTIKDGRGELTIINDNTQMDAVAVLNPSNNGTKLAIYIRSKDSFTISGIADGSYDMYFEMGNNWNSSSDKFTDKGGFYRLDRSLPFETIERSNGIEYSAWTVALETAAPNANEAAQKISVNEEDFPALNNR